MNRFLSWFCKIFLAPIIDCLLIKEIRGKKNFPRGNFILASNHSSYLDIIIDGYLCLPKRFHFIGQIDSWRGKARYLIRFLYFLSGTIPLNRKNGESRRRALKRAIKLLKRGDILVIYPEGRRTTDGKLQEARWGIAKIFLKTGVPILPVGIRGAFELFPPRGKLKIKKAIEINIGRPLFFEEEFNLARNLNENTLEYQQVLKKITNKIMEEISKLI